MDSRPHFITYNLYIMTVNMLIHDGNTHVKIPITEEKKDQIVNRVLDYCFNHDCFMGETLQQSDECLIDAPDLLTDIIDNILKPEVKPVD